MPAFFVKGDLFFADDLQALAHGCNCAGAMGKGIAKQFRQRYPEMYKTYKHQCSLGEFRLGDVLAWQEDRITIFNLATQRSWRDRADIEAIEKSLRTMVRMAESRAISRIGLPRIGSGLGGLPWTDVRAVLQKIGADTSVDLIVFEEYVSG